jgi:diguanylate cyclase (GGDEF)-like protein
MQMLRSGAFMPHGMCFLWQPGILALHVISDALIALAYFSIPLLLIIIARRRSDLGFVPMFVMFSLFIVSCGLTHIVSIIVIWHPIYWIEGWLKALTAALSIATAIAMVPLLPNILKLRSPAELEAVNAELHAVNERLADAAADAATAHKLLAASAEKLHELSVTDDLTNVANRRGFDVRLYEALAHCRRVSTHASVLMIDIDNFKNYNDTFGHLEGDVCLRTVADAIGRNVRRTRDLVARFGGEEFAVIMEGTDAIGARFMAERIRESVAELGVAQGDGARHPVVTVSVGVAAAVDPDQLIPDVLLNRADQALYAAKASGGNVVVAA